MFFNQYDLDAMKPVDAPLMSQRSGNDYLWHHSFTGGIFIDSQLIEPLTPIQRRILAFLIARPGAYLTKSEIINASWPDEVARMGVSDDALCQHICCLRKLLRQYSHHRYIVTWRGIPEGGYRFFNNGRFLPC